MKRIVAVIALFVLAALPPAAQAAPDRVQLNVKIERQNERISNLRERARFQRCRANRLVRMWREQLARVEAALDGFWRLVRLVGLVAHAGASGTPLQLTERDAIEIATGQLRDRMRAIPRQPGTRLCGR